VVYLVWKTFWYIQNIGICLPFISYLDAFNEKHFESVCAGRYALEIEWANAESKPMPRVVPPPKWRSPPKPPAEAPPWRLLEGAASSSVSVPKEQAPVPKKMNAAAKKRFKVSMPSSVPGVYACASSSGFGVVDLQPIDKAGEESEVLDVGEDVEEEEEEEWEEEELAATTDPYLQCKVEVDEADL